MKDYYSILGVSKDSSQEDIQKAFRTLAQRYHPDKEGGDVNKFKEINEAYQVLGDSEKRARYDAGGGVNGSHDFGGFNFSGFEDFFGGSRQGGGGGFSDIFNSIFHGMMNRGETVQIDVTVSFEESVFGTQKEITIPYRRKGAETVVVRIPAGAESESRLQIPGAGEPSRDGRSDSGDLLVRILVRPHEHLERRGGDIVYSLSLTLTEALLGTVKDIVALRGERLSVQVPELSRDGTSVVFQGKGIPRPAGTGRLVVLFHVIYPKSISAKDREILSGLRGEGW